MASLNTSEITVGTSATELVASDGDGFSIILSNTSDAVVYAGGADVTTASGFPVAAGASLSFYVPAGVSVFAAAGAAGKTVRVLHTD